MRRSRSTWPNWWNTARAAGDDRRGSDQPDADLLRAVRSGCPTNAIVAADSGSAANWYARHLKFTAGVRGSLSGTLATMGPGVPYVIGAKWAHPDRPAIAFVGDGAMQMNGMAELITIANYWTAVERPQADRRGAAQQRPQPGHLGDAGDGGARRSSRRPSPCPTSTTPASRAASACTARTSTTQENWAGRGTRALSADRPTVLDVRCDPDVPPIPPHATFEQAKSVVKAVLGGDEDAGGFIKQGFKQKVQQYLPGEKD